MTVSNNSSFIRPDELWRNIGLRAEQTVVHLGCGAGYYLIPAAHIVGKNGQAVGVDILPDMLAETDNRAKREELDNIVQTIRANLETGKVSSLPENTADWVLVANILHQSDPVQILKEARRLVKDNGKVVVIEWDIVATPFGPPADIRVSKQDTLDFASQVGLHPESNFDPSPYHYGLMLTKQSS